MDTTPPDEPTSVIDVAVRFIAAEPGGIERMLARHRRLPDGVCAGCLTHATAWPCVAADLALMARQHQQQDRPPHDERTQHRGVR